MNPLVLSFVFCIALLSPALSQENKDAPPAPTTPLLTQAQVANVLKQLEDLEKSIQSQRSSSLGAIIQKLRAAASSDAAAINFVTACEKLVNVERKDGDRKDAKKLDQKKEAEKREPRGAEAEKEGDFGTALRLCMEYLALSLEVRDVKDLSTVIPKITTFHQTMISQGKKIKGKAGEMLMQSIGGGGNRRGGTTGEIRSIVEAYQLDQYLHREGWPAVPGDIIDMYDKVIIAAAREKKKDDMPTLWDTALNTEATLRRVRLADGDYSVWESSIYPNLRWQRATDLALTGPSPVNGMADMLKVIKDYPNHPNAPDWVKQLRTMVAPNENKEDGGKTTAAQ